MAFFERNLFACLHEVISSFCLLREATSGYLPNHLRACMNIRP